MADFDLEKYVAEKSGAARPAASEPFDLEKYVAEKSKAAPALDPKAFEVGPEPTLMQRAGYAVKDAVGGAADYLNEAAHDGVVAAHKNMHLPELHGLLGGADRAAGTAIDAVTGGPHSLRDVPDAFHQGFYDTTARYAPAQAQGEARSPISTAIGHGVGDVALASLGAGAGRVASGAPKAVQALSAANGQGLVGAVINAGNSKSTDPLQIAKEAAIGYASGAIPAGAGAALGAGLSKPAKAVADSAEEFARMRAVKAAGAIGGDVAKVGTKRASEIGGRLLDDGLIPFGAKSEGIAARLGPAKNAAGESLDAIKGQMETLPGPRFNPMRAAQRIDDEIVSPLSKSVATEKDAQRFGDIANKLRLKAAPTIPPPEYTIRGGEAEKRGFQEAYGNYGKLKEALNPMAARENQMARIVKEESENAIEQTAAANGQSPLAAQFKDAKKRYGDLKTANLWAAKGAARDAGNRYTSLTDNLAGAAELAAGGPLAAPKAAATALLSKALRDRGASAMAVTGRAAAQKALQFATDGTGALGRYVGVLSNAANKGRLDTVHHLLMEKDPEYRKAFEEQP